MPPTGAHQACKACRRLKRKCSRDLPSCKLCARLHRVCEYPVNVTAGNVQSLGTPTYTKRQIQYAGGPLNQNIPVSYFLDSEHFAAIAPYCLVSSPQPPCVRLAHQLLADDDWEYIIDTYMATVHTWLPILSKKLLRKDVQLANNDGTSNGTLFLIVVMKALVQPSHDQLDLYNSAKQATSLAENGGFISMRLIQALCLLALYEMGHSIYPAAYLTIGRAARLGTMIGLHSENHALQLFKPADTWTMCEEKRRTWWSILMLDRSVVLGSTSLLMSAPDPYPDTLLPSNDAEWNEGKIGSNNALLTTHFHPAAPLGGFARVCQAVHVLGKVITHIQTRNLPLDVAGTVGEAAQLHRILESLQQSLTCSQTVPVHDAASNCAALAICVSARLLLYNQYGCNEPSSSSNGMRTSVGVELQQVSLDGIKSLSSQTVPAMAKQVYIMADSAPSRPIYSSALAYCLYRAATECAWFIKEEGGAEMASALVELVAALRALQGQWPVCGKYLTLLKTEGVIA